MSAPERPVTRSTAPTASRLDHHAAMYVGTTTRGTGLPCIGVVRWFTEDVPDDEVRRYAASLAANSDGFGRYVRPARVPGARSLWGVRGEPPPVRIAPPAPDRAALHELVDSEISTRLDPRSGDGWRVSAVRTPGGGTLVVVWLHHAYGDGNSVLTCGFDEDHVVAQGVAPGTDMLSLRRDAADLAERVRTGAIGTRRLARDLVRSGRRRGLHGELRLLAPSIAAARTRVGVGGWSTSRVAAFAAVDEQAWDATARAHGAVSNTLLVAVTANLIFAARAARGEESARPVRVLVPVDMRGRRRAGSAPAAPVTVNAASATVVSLDRPVPPGALDELQSRISTAIRDMLAAEGHDWSPHPPGVIDAMHLLPAAWTERLARRVQGDVDGVATNVGEIPGHVARVGTHRARLTFPLASPLRNDLAACLGRADGQVTLGVVADPARLGPTGSVQTVVDRELTAWGLVNSISRTPAERTAP